MKGGVGFYSLWLCWYYEMTPTLTKDLLLNMLLGLTALTVITLPMINDPAPKDDQGKQPGNMVVSAVWPEGDTDVDLWVQGPGDTKAVGYSNRGGKLFNLLRDDLGRAGDSMPMNYENAYSRGMPAGDYTVNVHLYRGEAPVTVAIEVRLGNAGEVTRLLYESSVTLQAYGQEITAINFTLDAAGNVTRQSKVYRPLRAVVKGKV